MGGRPQDGVGLAGSMGGLKMSVGPLSRRAALACGAAALGAAATLSAPALAQQGRPVRIGGTPNYGPVLPVNAALRLGLFEKAGVRAEFTGYSGGSASMEALAAGEADRRHRSASRTPRRSGGPDGIRPVRAAAAAAATRRAALEAGGGAFQFKAAAGARSGPAARPGPPSSASPARGPRTAGTQDPTDLAS